MGAAFGVNKSKKMTEQNKFFYSGFIKNIAQEFDQALDKIVVEYNFEYGPEFEIAVCKVLKNVLPEKYGICRGYVVTEAGQKAGDDIIIFDRMRFPTIRSQERDNFATKEHVPIDAAYAYIEAKHTLDLEGSGDSSLNRAINQAMRVKELCSERPQVSLQTLSNGLTLRDEVKNDLGWPSIRNPMFTAVFSRRIRKDGKIIENENDIQDHIDLEIPIGPHGADLIVAGRNDIIIPVVKNPLIDKNILSGFYIHGQSQYKAQKSPGLALAVGLCCLLWAIDWVQLQRMPLLRIIANAIEA